MNPEQLKSYQQKLVEQGPFVRGSNEWAAREIARQALGACCVNPYPIRKGQAYGEPHAKLQQVDTSEHVEKVRREIAFRKAEAMRR